MLCGIVLLVHYFAIYTALMAARTWSMAQGAEPNTLPIECVLRDATNTVNYAPMLTVLFLATRMKSLHLTNGQPDAYDLPQRWCKTSMVVCVAVLIAYTVLQLVSGAVSQKSAQLSIEGSHTGSSGIDTAIRVIAALKTIVILTLYVSFSLVCFAMLIMQMPQALKDPNAVAPATSSAALNCIIQLVIQYFAVCLLLQMSRTFDEVNGGRPSRITEVLKKSILTVNYAPMLCVLFLAARMRAIKLNSGGEPQDWAVPLYYSCAYCLLGQTVVAILGGLLGANLTEGQSEGDLKIERGSSSGGSRQFFRILNLIRWLFMIALYGSVITVLVSVWLLKASSVSSSSSGAKVVVSVTIAGVTPPMSTAILCTTLLLSLYFIVYIVLWVGISLQELEIRSRDMDNMVVCLTPAKETVMFAPMLCLLFIAARMRALQVTNSLGEPQGWVQDLMHISTWCLVFQVVIVLVVGSLAEARPQGSQKARVSVAFFQYLCVLVMYGSIVGIILGIFGMAADNCDGSGGFLHWPEFISGLGPTAVL